MSAQPWSERPDPDAERVFTLFEREDTGQRSVQTGYRDDQTIVTESGRVTDRAVEAVVLEEPSTLRGLRERWPDDLPDRLVEFLRREDGESA